MSVRLLFRVTEKKEVQSWIAGQKKMGSVVLTPATPLSGAPNEEEQRSFYAATPGGRIEFSTINQRALDQFEIGQEYYLTLQPVPVPTGESEVVAAT